MVVPGNPQSVEAEVEAGAEEARQISGVGFADITGEDIMEMIRPPAVTSKDIVEEDDVAQKRTERKKKLKCEA